MAPMVEAFGVHADKANYRPPTVTFVSAVTGAPETERLATPAYWRDHVLATVRFGAAVEALRFAGIEHFLEIGPQPTLLGMVARAVGDDSGLHASLRPQAGRDERAQMADAVGRLWTAGVEIDWPAIDRGRSEKLDLPTYPFQRQRYWLADTESRVAAATPAPAADDDVYVPQWVPLPAAVPSVRRRDAWLVVGGADAGAMAAELGQRGLRVRVVADVRDETAAGTWAGVVLTGAGSADGLDPVAAQRVRLEPLLALVQRLLAHEVELADGGRLWVLTRNGQSVPGPADPVDLAEAPVWGLANAITVEEPNLRVGCIDLDPRPGGDVALVVDELLDGGAEDRVALRTGARHGLRLARLQEPAPATGLDGASLAGDGAYLITGGLGSLGLNAARSLAARGATRIALLGRRRPSDAALAAITELRDAGVAVTVFAGDVADAARVETVTGEIRATMGPLRGVIHAAGVLDDGTLRNLDWSRFESVLRRRWPAPGTCTGPRSGTVSTSSCSFSSASALLGASGQANYTAANAFLDALAHHRQARGRPGLSIDWGGWDEVGMAARLDDGQRTRLVQSGVGLIDPATGDRLLGRLLTTSAAQVAVVPVDWSDVARTSPAAMQRPFYQALSGRHPGGGSHGRGRPGQPRRRARRPRCRRPCRSCPPARAGRHRRRSRVWRTPRPSRPG